jgi:hypothetical protein
LNDTHVMSPTDVRPAHVIPALVAARGDAAARRYVEFFTANVRNSHTRRAYARACARFFAWCEQRGLTLSAISPFDVAAWVNVLQETHGAPGVKQQLAAGVTARSGSGGRPGWRRCLLPRHGRCGRRSTGHRGVLSGRSGRYFLRDPVPRQAKQGLAAAVQEVGPWCSLGSETEAWRLRWSHRVSEQLDLDCGYRHTTAHGEDDLLAATVRVILVANSNLAPPGCSL